MLFAVAPADSFVFPSPSMFVRVRCLSVLILGRRRYSLECMNQVELRWWKYCSTWSFLRLKWRRASTAGVLKSPSAAHSHSSSAQLRIPCWSATPRECDPQHPASRLRPRNSELVRNPRLRCSRRVAEPTGSGRQRVCQSTLGRGPVLTVVGRQRAGRGRR